MCLGTWAGRWIVIQPEVHDGAWLDLQLCFSNRHLMASITIPDIHCGTVNRRHKTGCILDTDVRQRPFTGGQYQHRLPLTKSGLEDDGH